MARQKKLITRLFPSYLLITIVSLLIVTWYVLTTLHNFFIEQTRQDLTARALLVKHHIMARAPSFDATGIDSICKTSGHASRTRITVIRPSGRVIGDTEKDPASLDNHANRPEIRAAIQNGLGSAIRYSSTLKKKMMYVAVPVKKEGQVDMIIRTSVPLSSVYSALGAVRAQIVGVGLAVALLAVVASFFVSRKIVQPIQEMKTGAAQFADGNMERKLAIPDTLELAGLAQALNDMAVALSEKIRTIQRQKNEIETVFASMTEAVIAFDNEDRVLRINHAAEYFLGHQEESVRGKRLYEIIRNHKFIKFAKAAAAMEAANTTEDDIVFEINDQKYLLNTKSAPLIDENRQRIGTLLVLADVTRVRQLENIRKEFAANVSHEIKTPLTSIQGFAEELMANRAVTENEEARHYLDIIVKNVRRLSAIIENVLRLSDIEHGNRQKDFHFEEIKVASVIDSAVNICKSEANRKAMQIITDCDPALTARMDFALMEQALVNLLSNAVRYSPDGSRIDIVVSVTDESVAIRIADKGVGIDAVHIPRLFERFYRVDKARSRKMGGTGLGLAIVKHVVQIHDGKIDVESTPGQGSAFTVSLPRS